ncbi:helix-turn-helix domain-containing protein [Actinomadura chibensis]|uniref:Helix-turn-helix domain-containing protein n=1 Tax=Actinomadura chibensis TaxID=392828 RepID=A0A5D0N1Q1_9ACTN|nr:helix-turn-helix domain-containing protein [Actinomadura chibensis]TYB38400.1 helix-turn-helix domain-containing protein [Actinomadura chibensis]
MSMVIRTADLPAAERFDFWRSSVSETFVPLRAETTRPELFEGRIRGRELGALKVTEVASTPSVVRRTGALIARSDPGHYKIGVQLNGYCLLTQDGREAALVPGDFTIYDTTRPYTLAFDDSYRQLVLMVPRRLLHLPEDAIARVTATRISGRQGVGALLSAFLVQLAEQLDELDDHGGVRLGDNIADLLVTLFAEHMDMSAPTPESRRRALLLRVRAYIERHLDDPDLSPDDIAAAHFVSSRHLYNLFREEGTTVSSWIKERRLEHCRRDLRDPLQLNRPVSAIAARWGFVDAAHFSRLFKAAYGASPREYRVTVSDD